MFIFIQNKLNDVISLNIKRLLVIILAFSLSLGPSASYAQTLFPVGAALNLPVPGTMVTLSPAYAPAIIKGIRIFPDNPLRFDFIMDTGDSGLEGDNLKEESTKLIKYFLASLTVPEEDLWVNLSPYEKDRVIPEDFGVTEMGRDLLAQDYILKQITASLMYPEDELGKEFWDKIYKKAYEEYGTTEIPVNTFNKVWIVPEKAVVYENGDMAFVVESRLKVMLEQDYVALQHSRSGERSPKGEVEPEDYLARRSSPVARVPQTEKTRVTGNEPLATNIIREIIIPALEKEVNEGTHFANLRQIYHSMILATWFKRNLRQSVLGKIYVDQNKTAGVDIEDKDAKNKIYNQYIEAFKKGVYNYIKEDYDPNTKEMIPRKYFSGGAGFFGLGAKVLEQTSSPVYGGRVQDDMRKGFISSTILNPEGSNNRLMKYASSPAEDSKNASSPVRTNPQTTSRFRNIDVYRNVMRLRPFLEMLEKKGINLREDHHKVVNVGIGGMPFDTLQLKEELEVFDNPDIKVAGTERFQAMARVHISSKKLLDKYRIQIVNILSKDLEIQGSLEGDDIFDLRLVVTPNGSLDKAGISEALVGFKHKGHKKYYHITVDRNIRYVIFGEKQQGRNADLLDDFVEFLGVDRIKEAMDGLSKDDIIVERHPITQPLENAGIDVMSTEELGKGIQDVSVMMVNYVTLHMFNEEREEFMNNVNQSLSEGGVVVIKTGALVESELINIIHIRQKIGGKLVYQGSLTSDTVKGSLFNADDFELQKRMIVSPEKGQSIKYFGRVGNSPLEMIQNNDLKNNIGSNPVNSTLEGDTNPPEKPLSSPVEDDSSEKSRTTDDQAGEIRPLVKDGEYIDMVALDELVRRAALNIKTINGRPVEVMASILGAEAFGDRVYYGQSPYIYITVAYSEDPKIHKSDVRERLSNEMDRLMKKIPARGNIETVSPKDFGFRFDTGYIVIDAPRALSTILLPVAVDQQKDKIEHILAETMVEVIREGIHEEYRSAQERVMFFLMAADVLGQFGSENLRKRYEEIREQYRKNLTREEMTDLLIKIRGEGLIGEIQSIIYLMGFEEIKRKVIEHIATRLFAPRWTDEEIEIVRLKLPNMARVYPGGNSQFPGMGKDFYEQSPVARAFLDRVFKTAFKPYGDRFQNMSDVFDLDPNDPIFNEYEFAAPLTFVTSVAILEYFKHQSRGKLEPKVVTGLSLGFFAALVDAGVLSAEDALEIIHERTRLTREVFPRKDVRLYMVTGVSEYELEEIFKHFVPESTQPEDTDIAISVQSAVNRFVVAFPEWRVQEFKKKFDEIRPRIRVSKLNLMDVITHHPKLGRKIGALKEFLSSITFAAPDKIVILNSTGMPVSEVPPGEMSEEQKTSAIESIRQEILDQLMMTVRWADVVETLKEQFGIQSTLQIGGASISASERIAGPPIKNKAAYDKLIERNSENSSPISSSERDEIISKTTTNPPEKPPSSPVEEDNAVIRKGLEDWWKDEMSGLMGKEYQDYPTSDDYLNYQNSFEEVAVKYSEIHNSEREVYPWQYKDAHLLMMRDGFTPESTGIAPQLPTSKGKTLALVMAAYAEIKSGKSKRVDIMTFNSAHAFDTFQEMGPLLKALGVNIGFFEKNGKNSIYKTITSEGKISEEKDREEARAEALSADIRLGAGESFVWEYMSEGDFQVADRFLMDELETIGVYDWSMPMSGKDRIHTERAQAKVLSEIGKIRLRRQRVFDIIKPLFNAGEYEVDPQTLKARWKGDIVKKIKKDRRINTVLRMGGVYVTDFRLRNMADGALAALLLREGYDYIIEDKEIVIKHTATHRLKRILSYSDEVNGMLVIKEERNGNKMRRPPLWTTVGYTSYKEYLALYSQGGSGTGATLSGDKDELKKNMQLDVHPIMEKDWINEANNNHVTVEYVDKKEERDILGVKKVVQSFAEEIPPIIVVESVIAYTRITRILKHLFEGEPADPGDEMLIEEVKENMKEEFELIRKQNPIIEISGTVGDAEGLIALQEEREIVSKAATVEVKNGRKVLTASVFTFIVARGDDFRVKGEGGKGGVRIIVIGTMGVKSLDRQMWGRVARGDPPDPGEVYQVMSRQDDAIKGLAPKTSTPEDDIEEGIKKSEDILRAYRAQASEKLDQWVKWANGLLNGINAPKKWQQKLRYLTEISTEHPDFIEELEWVNSLGLEKEEVRKKITGVFLNFVSEVNDIESLREMYILAWARLYGPEGSDKIIKKGKAEPRIFALIKEILVGQMDNIHSLSWGDKLKKLREMHSEYPLWSRIEKEEIERALKKRNGNQDEASKLLGINRTTLRLKIKYHNINIGEVLSKVFDDEEQAIIPLKELKVFVIVKVFEVVKNKLAMSKILGINREIIGGIIENVIKDHLKNRLKDNQETEFIKSLKEKPVLQALEEIKNYVTWLPYSIDKSLRVNLVQQYIKACCNGAIGDKAEKDEIERALKKSNGNRNEASKLLGINRKTLWLKIKYHNINIGEVLSKVFGDETQEIIPLGKVEWGIRNAVFEITGKKKSTVKMLGIGRKTLDKSLAAKKQSSPLASDTADKNIFNPPPETSTNPPEKTASSVLEGGKPKKNSPSSPVGEGEVASSSLEAFGDPSWGNPNVQQLADNLSEKGIAWLEANFIKMTEEDKKGFSLAFNRKNIWVNNDNPLIQIIEKPLQEFRYNDVKELANAKRKNNVPTFFIYGKKDRYFELNLEPFGYLTVYDLIYKGLIEFALGFDNEIIKDDLREEIIKAALSSFRFGLDKWFLHNHLHNENILIKFDKNKMVSDIKFIDWKMVGFMPIPADILLSNAVDDLKPENADISQFKIDSSFPSNSKEITYDFESQLYIETIPKKSNSIDNRDVNSSPVNQLKKGGIDLNPANLDLQTTGQGMDFDIPFTGLPCIDDDNDGICERVDIEGLENMHIEGFTPVIFQIVPVTNLPLLLGIADEAPLDDERERASIPARDDKFYFKYEENEVLELSGV